MWRVYTFPVAFNPLARIVDNPGPPLGGRTVPLTAPTPALDDIARVLGIDLRHAVRCLHDAA
jgi:hypothetical protein